MDGKRFDQLATLMAAGSTRRSTLGLLAGVAGLGLGKAAAGGRRKTLHATQLEGINGQAKLYRGQGYGTCSGTPDDAGLPVVGFVNYHLEDDGVTLKVNWHIQDGVPNATYLAGFRCIPGASFVIKTNGKGVGNGTYSTTDWTYGGVPTSPDGRARDENGTLLDYFNSGPMTNLL